MSLDRYDGFLLRETGEADQAQQGGGVAPARCPFRHEAPARAPSTALRAVNLPRSAGDDSGARHALGWWAFAAEARAAEARV